MNLNFTLFAHEYSILRGEAKDPLPAWLADSAEFISVTRTPWELSIVVHTSAIGPGDFRRDDGWRLLGLKGPIAFETTGVAAEFTTCLAREKISVMVIATFDTDYLLVKKETLEAAIAALERAGHRVAAAAV